MMGYPRDLDDYKSSELLIELNRRIELTNTNQCVYCRQWKRDCTCKHKDRWNEYHDVNFNEVIVQDLM